MAASAALEPSAATAGFVNTDNAEAVMIKSYRRFLVMA
jgi:hypothetical protein